MSSRFCQCSSLHLLIGLFIFGSISAISAHENEDPTIKTMEAFSGYPIHESNSLVSDFVSSLSVETQTLQNQSDFTIFDFGDVYVDSRVIICALQ
ncbi:hypothetical protein Q3G72_003891 [Acer saccharum]|nr:hypothetical protein Q3G72_003891 [Acer saccharum]